jgi:hypothetical protein
VKSELGWLLGTVVGVLIVVLCLPLMPVFWAVSKLTD